MNPFNRRRERKEELGRIDRRLAKLEDRTAKILERLRTAQPQVAQVKRTPTNKPQYDRLKVIQEGIESLLRAQYLEGDPELEYPQRLTLRRFRLSSQNLEDGLTLAILREAGMTTRRFIDIGCGENGGNSGFLAEELGFAGMMIDADPARLAVTTRVFTQPSVEVLQAWITRDGINELIAAHGLEGEVDLLSIDIDGNDYWVWEALEACNPRLVIVEFNSSFGADRAVVVPYAEDFERKAPKRLQRRYYGASLAALDRLADRKGYRLVAVEPRGTNAYFLRNDLATHVSRAEPPEVYRMLNKDANLEINLDFDVYEAIEESGLELVDLDVTAST